MLTYDFPTFAIFMMFYSFIGWFYESTVYSLAEQGKFMNRGCFIGPYCPIYSVALIVSYYLLLPIKNPWVVILVAGVIVSTIEFITSVTLEKLFHATYWDYSNYPLNFQGRVSVPSGLFFGVALMWGTKCLHPWTLKMIGMMHPAVRLGLCIFFCIIFFSDAILTTIAMINLNKKCKEIYDHIDSVVEGKLDTLNEKKAALAKFKIVRKGQQAVVMIKGIPHEIDEVTRRFMRKKKFHSTEYADIIDKINAEDDALSAAENAMEPEVDSADFSEMQEQKVGN